MLSITEYITDKCVYENDLYHIFEIIWKLQVSRVRSVPFCFRHAIVITNNHLSENKWRRQL
jgi:hypothetical protein